MDAPVVPGSLSEVVAAVPYLVGAAQQDAVVIVPGHECPSPVGRFELPENEEELQRLAAGVTAMYGKRDVSVVVAAFTERVTLADQVYRRVAEALSPSSQVISIAVEGDRWVRLDRSDAGTVTPADRDRMGAEFMVRGHDGVYASMDALRKTFQPRNLIPQDVMQEAHDAATAVIGDPGSRAVEQAWLGLVIGRYTTLEKLPGTRVAARMIADVQHTQLRDHALASIERPEAGAHAHVWNDLLRRSPEGFEAAPSCLTGFAYWLAEQPTKASLALGRVPLHQPYPLASLLERAIRTGLDPASWSVPPELKPHNADAPVIAKQLRVNFTDREPPPASQRGGHSPTW